MSIQKLYKFASLLLLTLLWSHRFQVSTKTLFIGIRVCTSSQVTGGTPLTASRAHLCEVKVHEAEGEELQADGEAVEQPEGNGSQRVGRHKVLKVEGEEHGAQRRPQQAQGQEHGLVAEALVSVPQDQPELDVDEDEEEGVEDGVDHGQA